jgi:hypothetical protein
MKGRFSLSKFRGVCFPPRCPPLPSPLLHRRGSTALVNQRNFDRCARLRIAFPKGGCSLFQGPTYDFPLYISSRIMGFSREVAEREGATFFFFFFFPLFLFIFVSFLTCCAALCVASLDSLIECGIFNYNKCPGNHLPAFVNSTDPKSLLCLFYFFYPCP